MGRRVNPGPARGWKNRTGCLSPPRRLLPQTVDSPCGLSLDAALYRLRPYGTISFVFSFTGRGRLVQSSKLANTLEMIYFDHNATTPVLPEVIAAMLPYLAENWGNPSSSYRFGSGLKTEIETARSQIAVLVNASPREIVFTSCATESNNTALNAALRANPAKRHIITSATEHSSVLNFCKACERDGYRVTCLPVDRDGLISLADLKQAITDDTAVVSLMWANNETGVVFPVVDIAELCRAHGILYHCDAVQAVGKIAVDLECVAADYLSLSGHKFGAPKGIGALYVRKQSPFTPLIYGGGQEQSRRGGTENIPYIIGLGIAASLAQKQLPVYENHVRRLRDIFETEILRTIPCSELNGRATWRLPNTTNIHLVGMDNTAVLALLDQTCICASSGSACMDSAITPSHVITAMTHSRKHAGESIRFSLGSANTDHEINAVAVRLKEISQLML